MIYVTSDLHFGHNKEFIYQQRGFNTIQEHDEALIHNFNEILTENDVLYILGDVFLCDNKHGIECLEQLIGEKHLIRGNHDTKQKCKRMKDFVIDEGYANILDYQKYHFYLSHYPTITSNYDDGKYLSQRMINLSGHTHFKDKFFDGNPFIYNVAVDAHDCKPVSIEEILQDIRIERDKKMAEGTGALMRNLP